MSKKTAETFKIQLQGANSITLAEKATLKQATTIIHILDTIWDACGNMDPFPACFKDILEPYEGADIVAIDDQGVTKYYFEDHWEKF